MQSAVYVLPPTFSHQHLCPSSDKKISYTAYMYWTINFKQFPVIHTSFFMLPILHKYQTRGYTPNHHPTKHIPMPPPVSNMFSVSFILFQMFSSPTLYLNSLDFPFGAQLVSGETPPHQPHCPQPQCLPTSSPSFTPNPQHIPGASEEGKEVSRARQATVLPRRRRRDERRQE